MRSKVVDCIKAIFSTTGTVNILCWIAFLAVGIVTHKPFIYVVSFIFLVIAITRRKMFIRRAKAPDIFWTQFVHENPEMRDCPHQIWRVTNRPIDEEDIVTRIDSGEVCGEAFSVDYFEYYNQPLPHVGDINIICDNGNNPYFIVHTIDVIPCRFGSVDNRLARIEGYKTATAWKAGNESKFKGLCQKADVKFSNETRLFFEQFSIVYRGVEKTKK